MKKYHVEILTPIEIIAEAIPARSRRDAMETTLASAGFTGLRFCWYEGSPVTPPPRKRPCCAVYQDRTGAYLRCIAWTE